MTCRFSLRSVGLGLWLALGVSPASGQAGRLCIAPESALRLDHVPIAVADLDALAARLTGFGFSAKPGRPHSNGLENLHIPFIDGSALELMTVDEPGDAVARRTNVLRRFEGTQRARPARSAELR